MEVDLRCVGVLHGRQFVAGLQVFALGSLAVLAAVGESGHRVSAAGLLLAEPFGRVEPVLRGHVGHPGMLESTVVEDHVHDDFQPFGMRFVGQPPVFGVGSEARIHSVVVGGGVAVVGAEAVVVGRIVLQDGSEPERGDAQLVEIVEMLAYAFEVAAVPQRWLRTVVHVGVEPFQLVVVSTPGGETVGHQHVEHVGIGESHALVACHLARLELVVGSGLRAFRGELQLHGAGLCVAQVQVDQQIVRRVKPNQAVNPYTRIVGCDAFNVADALSVDHQLHRRVLQSHEPVGGLNPFNHIFLCCTHCQNVCHHDGGE